MAEEMLQEVKDVLSCPRLSQGSWGPPKVRFPRPWGGGVRRAGLHPCLHRRAGACTSLGSSCAEDEAVAAPGCGTWQLERSGPETSWDRGGSHRERHRSKPAMCLQASPASALNRFCMPWVSFCLEPAQSTKLCMIFCLRLQALQKLSLSACARRLPPAPGAAKTAPEAARESPARSLGTSLALCSAAAPWLRGRGGDGARGTGSSPVLGRPRPCRHGACWSRFPAIKVKLAGSFSQMKGSPWSNLSSGITLLINLSRSDW